MEAGVNAEHLHAIMMDNADLLVSIGSRFVCQADSSRTGYPNVAPVIRY